MPGYYQQRPIAGSLPPTPPDSGSAYSYSSVPFAQEPYMSHPSAGQSRHDAAYEYQQSYAQPAVAPAPASYSYPQATYAPANSLPPIQTSYYEPMGAPILPPIRTYDHVAFAPDYQRQQLRAEQQTVAAREQTRQNAKEEKATGGVSAKLDYDMERMTDFVADAAHTMYAFHVSPVCLADIDVTRSFRQSTADPAFRKWVNQVLSATRLPSSTILLSLHYLHDRIMKYPSSVRTGDINQVYRLLAVSLILGSKFLDDNTFINRSWADVTSIKVTELNLLEMNWLHLINYQLHVELKEDDGLLAWIAAWRKYDADYVAKQQPARLSPLDTNVYRHTSSRDSRYSPYPTPYSASARSFNASLSARSPHYSTPYSSTDSWAVSSLDKYYSEPQPRFPDYAEIEAVSRRDDRAHHHYQYPQSAHPSYYHTPTYSAWDQSAWNGMHRLDCKCSTCVYQHHYRPYTVSSSYAAQTVMG